MVPASGLTDAVFVPFSPSVSAWLERAQADSGSSWPLLALPPLTLPNGLSASTEVAVAYDNQAATVDATSLRSPPASVSSSQADSASPFSSSSSSSSSSSFPLPISAAASSTAAASSADTYYLSAYLDHRRVDLQRRQKERVALRRLDELLAEEGADDQSTAVTDLAEASDKSKKHKRRQRLSVLDASAARIQRLEQELRAARQDIRKLSEEVGSVAARERLCVQWMDASRALHGGGLLHDRLVTTLINCRTGRLLDASSSFFDFTGFTPGGVLQRVLNRVDSTSTTGEDRQLPDSEYPLVQAKRKANGIGADDKSESIEWVPQRAVKQYPHSLGLLQELLTGQRSSVRASFRCRHADGFVYEPQEMACWVVDVDAEWVQEADGRRWRRPLTFATAYFMDNCVQVEEE